MEFNIPLTREDVIYNGNKINIIPHNDLTGRIEECQTSFAELGSVAINNCFDVFYSVIHNFNDISQSVREHYWHIIIEALVDACNITVTVNNNSLIQEDKSDKRSTIKMLMYIVCQFVEEFESLLGNTETLQVTKKRKTKKAVTASDGCGSMWDDERERVLNTLLQFIDQDIEQYWDPPTPEMCDDIMSLIGNVCYKMLENVEVSRDKEIKNSISLLIGLIIKKYHQNTSVCVKIVQLLQNNEHLINCLSHIIKQMSTEYNIHSFITDIINEICSIDCEDINIDSSGAKNYSLFILELTQLLPQHVLPSVNNLIIHLEGESYTMRNGVLGVFGELISQCLTGQSLSNEERELREMLFNKLTIHIHDVNAFVRSKVLQVWLLLNNKRSIPLVKQRDILVAVTGRLKDKSSLVRKSALQLLTNFITANPFSPKLDLNTFKDNLLKEEEKLKSMLPSTMRQDIQQQSMEGDNERNEEETQDNEEGTQDNEQQEGTQDDGQQEGHEASEVAKQMACVQYHRDAVGFIESIAECLPLVSQLLGSKVITDILESLSFISQCYTFNIKGSHDSIRKCLVLIWSTEQTIRDLVMNIYTHLFLTPPSTCSSRYVTIATNLLTLINDINIGEMTSFEQLMICLIRKGSIPQEVINILWDIFIGRRHGNTPLLALILLSMISKEEPVQDNITLLCQHGLQHNDLILTKYTCITLTRLKDQRLLPTHEIFTKLTDIIIATSNDRTVSQWCPLTEQFIILIYKLAEYPDYIIENIIKQLCSNIFNNEEGVASLQTTPTNINALSSLALSRLFFLLGQVAKQQLVHVEIHISKELKKRRGKTTPTTTAGNVTTPTTNEETNNEVTMETEGVELGGATEEDIESQLINKVCNEEICHSTDSILGSLLSLIIDVITKCIGSNTLQVSAVLALSKYMLVSSHICDKYLRLLFTLLEESQIPDVRANTVIALGDLTVRYPNLIQPWSTHLYSRLRDTCHTVRLNTIVVLTHLILNDMIKVKGQISEMALCLQDSSPDISDRAKLFFMELSRKGNALYNVLPDIISHLSDPSTNDNNSIITSDVFRNIMKHLLSFVQKDKQSEGLADKLCHRFRATRTGQQVKDLAFCLSQINFNDRGLRKLQDNLPCYHGYLHDSEVYNFFLTIIGKGKKLAKPDTKSLLEEYETKLTQIHNRDREQDENTIPPLPSTPSLQEQVPTTPMTAVGTAVRTPMTAVGIAVRTPMTAVEGNSTVKKRRRNAVTNNKLIPITNSTVTSVARRRRVPPTMTPLTSSIRRTRRAVTPIPLLSDHSDSNDSSDN